MNGDNAFTKSWDFICTVMQYVFARYGEAASKMGGSFDPEWNAKTFFAGLSEMAYLTVIIGFIMYLLFRGFSANKGYHIAVLIALIALSVASCIG